MIEQRTINERTTEKHGPGLAAYFEFAFFTRAPLSIALYLVNDLGGLAHSTNVEQNPIGIAGFPLQSVFGTKSFCSVAGFPLFDPILGQM